MDYVKMPNRVMFVWLTMAVMILNAACATDESSGSDSFRTTPESGAYGFTVKDIGGDTVELARYKGKVALVVNVASECGLTPQYAELVELYEQYKEEGFTVLAFPANNFGNQEPGTNEEIQAFCSTQFQVTFPLFAKISAKGDDIAPLYAYLTSEEENPDYAGEIEWNFAKFLVNKEGQVVERFGPAMSPTSEDVTNAIKKHLDGDA